MQIKTHHPPPRTRYAMAAYRTSRVASKLRSVLKANPWWHLQPRAPAGVSEGGQWISVVGSVAGPLWQALRALGMAAARRVRGEGERARPQLLRLPRRWTQEDSFPAEEAFDRETGRIGPPTRRRPRNRLVRFRNERELREYLGSAGEGWEWHHIVEKRLVAIGRFRAEMIHNTDNIIRLPRAVHLRISSEMSKINPQFSAEVRRIWLQRYDFDVQYNHGLDLIEQIAQDLGYEIVR